MFAEENKKRTAIGYGQIGFNYDESSSPSQSSTNEKSENENKDEAPDETYVPHPRFYIPPNMELVCIQHFLDGFTHFSMINFLQMSLIFYSRKQQKCKQSLKRLRDSFQHRVYKWRF